MAGPPTRRTRNTRRSDAAPVASAGIPAGIYVGRVVSHLDKKFMGSLKVMLLKITEAGNDYQETNQLITAHRATPYGGQTPLQNVGSNNTYSESQQAYGFWGVPPDIGTKVLVMMVEGARDFGYWVGCIQDDFVNFMIPDGRVSTINNDRGQKLPVGEYNKAIVNPEGETQPTRFPKPVNTDFEDSLSEAGLIEDDIRGLTSSSARREVPSQVFGISTPGPMDKRDGAPRHGRGATGKEASVPSSRLGGWSIVMDDGDDKILRVGNPGETPKEYVDVENTNETGDVVRPANELFRIRSRTGAQILLHSTEDLIYIANSKGTAWIEMTSNGKIDIYAEDSVSIHSSQDMNFTADRDINFDATANININAGEKVKTTAGQSLDFTSMDYTAFVAGKGFTAKADSYMAMSSGKAISIDGANAINITSSGANINMAASAKVNMSGKSGIHIGTEGSLHEKVGQYFRETNASHVNSQEYFVYAKGGLHLKSDADAFLSAKVTANIKGKSTYIQSFGGDTHMKSNADLKIQTSGNINQFATSILRNATATIQDRAGTSFNLSSLGSMSVKADTTLDAASTGAMKINANASLDIISTGSAKITGKTMDLKTTGGVLIAEASSNLQLEGALVQIDAGNTATGAATANPTPAVIASIAVGAIDASVAATAVKPNPVTPDTPIISLIAKTPSRIPQHEPWLQHESNNPAEYTPEKTRAGVESVDSFVQQIPDTFVNIGSRSTKGSTTASDRGGYSGSQNYTPATDGEFGEETLGDFGDLKRDQIYAIGDSHAEFIANIGGYRGSARSGATVEQIASNQVGRIPEKTIVVVSAGNNNWDSDPTQTKDKIQKDIVDPLLQKGCYVIFVVFPDIDLSGPYASTYSSAGYTANYNDVRNAVNQVSANGQIDLTSADINPQDPMKIHATTAAYQRVVDVVEKAIEAIPDPSEFDKFNGTLGPLLAAIRICEIDTAEPRSFDVVYGGIPTNIRPQRPITQMSIGDVLEWQKSIRNSVASTATGAYQFIYPTLKYLIDDRKICSRGDLMTPANQDKLAIALMRNLQKWKDGQMSDEEFGYGLSKVWASMPLMIDGAQTKRNGPGTANSAYYGGVGPNPSTARKPASFIKEALVKSKQGLAGENETTDVTIDPEALAALGFEAGDPYEQLKTRSRFTDFGSTQGDLEDVDRVHQAQGSAGVRRLPCDRRLIDILNRAAAAAGVYVQITSGGQMSKAEWQSYPRSQRKTTRDNKDYWILKNGTWIQVRTGSTRHDTGLAADLNISKSKLPGGTLIPYNFSSPGRGENNQIWDNLIYHAFKFGCRGFGFAQSYMGNVTIHLDTLGKISGNGWNGELGYWETSDYFINIARKGIQDA